MYYVKIKADRATAEEIKDFYGAEEIIDDSQPYDFFLAKNNGVIIHAYRSKNNMYTILFQSKGVEAVEEAQQFSDQLSIQERDDAVTEQKNISDGWDDISSQIGSDEVGVGDFFGPLVVTAVYVCGDDIAYLQKLRINDSKKMSDDWILEIGPRLKRRIKNYVVLLSPEKLSELASRGLNMHRIMSSAHNASHKGIIEKYDLDTSTIVYIDQFESEENYRRYVGGEVIENPLYFKTKGETYYPSVAAASVISRYHFLKEWQSMEKKLGCVIPKGASATVDKVYNRLVNLYGRGKVDPYVKKFFRNYQRG